MKRFLLRTIEELFGARTSQLEDLQFWENAKEMLTVQLLTKYFFKNSTTQNDLGDERGLHVGYTYAVVQEQHNFTSDVHKHVFYRVEDLHICTVEEHHNTFVHVIF
jgi:hypothetical protein